VAAATTSTTDPDAGNNDGSDPASRVTTSIGEFADLVATKTGPASIDAATNFSYTVAVANDGPSAAASVVVTTRCAGRDVRLGQQRRRGRLGGRDLADDRQPRQRRRTSPTRSP